MISTSYAPPIGVTGEIARSVLNANKTETQNLIPVEELRGQPTFLDVFKQIFGDAVDTTTVQAEDRIRLLLGDADDLEQIQLNIQKAELAVELLTNVRNSILDSYNEIIRMQI